MHGSLVSAPDLVVMWPGCAPSPSCGAACGLCVHSQGLFMVIYRKSYCHLDIRVNNVIDIAWFPNIVHPIYIIHCFVCMLTTVFLLINVFFTYFLSGLSVPCWSHQLNPTVCCLDQGLVTSTHTCILLCPWTAINGVPFAMRSHSAFQYIWPIRWSPDALDDKLKI